MRFCGWSGHVYICKTGAHLWMEMKICEGELAVENRVTYLLMKLLRCEWDLIHMNRTTHMWTGPLTFGRNPWIISLQMEAPFTSDGLVTRGGTDYTWRTTDSQYQPVDGISTCDRVFHVWTGHVYVNGSCTCEGPSTRERDIHVWMERDVYLWMEFRQTS